MDRHYQPVVLSLLFVVNEGDKPINSVLLYAVLGDTQSSETPIEPIPEYSAKEELEDEKNWRAVNIGDKQYKIDMKVIEPYKKVLSHGGK